jgi:hypothetical protein
MLYGNNIVGDELNNVEQITVDSPSTSVTYSVIVTSKVFTESSSQSVSIVITSGGRVTSRMESTVTESSAYDPMKCRDANGVMVTVKMMDRGGDGWGTGNSYQITDSNGAVVHSNTLSGSTSDDILYEDKICLSKNADYDVILIQTGSNTNDMAISIDACYIYLSQYKTSASISLDSGECNICDDYVLNLYLYGSAYLSIYGWTEGSHYIISKVTDSTPVAVGTLATGVLDKHLICLSDGFYNVKLTGTPISDDLLDDDYMSSAYGVNEYYVGFTNCNNDASDIESLTKIKASSERVVEVSGSTVCSSATHLTFNNMLTIMAPIVGVAIWFGL